MGVRVIRRQSLKTGLIIVVSCIFLLSATAYLFTQYVSYKDHAILSSEQKEQAFVPVASSTPSPTQDEAVLGAKAATCMPSEQLATVLTQKQVKIDLYAPDKTVTLDLASLASCINFQGCEAGQTSCKTIKTSVSTSCLENLYKTTPLPFATTVSVYGQGTSVLVSREDWSVNYSALAEQIKNTLESELNYCQVSGSEPLKTKLDPIQVPVTDTAPAIMQPLAKRFTEIDISKEMLYFWNDGVYQAFPLVKGFRLPQEGIYRYGVEKPSRWLKSIDASYLDRTSQKNDLVVIHD